MTRKLRRKLLHLLLAGLGVGAILAGLLLGGLGVLRLSFDDFLLALAAVGIPIILFALAALIWGAVLARRDRDGRLP